MTEVKAEVSAEGKETQSPDFVKELAKELEILDAALAAQGEEVEAPTQREQIEMPSLPQYTLAALATRVTAIEQRLDDHNVRSAHKI